QQPQPGQQSQQYYQQPQQGQQFQQAPGGGQTYMGNQFYNEQYQKMKQKSSTYISTLVQTFLSIFRYPYNKGKEYVSGANEKLAIGFIAVHAIFSGLFSLVIARQINYTFDQLSNALSSQSSWSNSSSLLSGSKSVSNVMEVSYAKFFFIVLIFSALFSFILAGLLFVANKVLKGNASFKEILCLTSIRSVVISPFILVSLLLAFLSPMLGAYLFIGCEILAMFYVYAATPVNDPNAKERLPIVMFVVVLLFVIISFIIMKNAVVLLLPDKLKDAMDQISNFSFNQYLN
ncbi:MAG: YIP1 family protein, partial [bacterium]|nr:YIP1 family protein [bacterium]